MTIDYPTCPKDNQEWSIAKFREWRATRDPCFIVDLLVLDPFDPYLLVDILRDYTLEFEVRVESTFKDLREPLTKAIKDKDCYKELNDTTVEDYDEMGIASVYASRLLDHLLWQHSCAFLYLSARVIWKCVIPQVCD